MKKINSNKKRNIILAVIIFIILLISIFLIIKRKILETTEEVVLVKDDEQSQEQIEWLENEKETVDINNIINLNLENQINEVIEKEIVELEYETIYQNNDKLPKGMVGVLQQGQDGKQELIIKKQYSGEKLISDKQVGRQVISAPIDRIVEVGTSSYYDSHKIKIGDTVYATPYELSIKKEPKKDAETIVRINQNSKLKIIKKKQNWYYINYELYYGWIETDCVTYIIQNNITYNNSNETYSKKVLLAKLSKNMSLNKPSGLSLEQFEKIFSNENKDKNNIFKENAKYFYYIEQAYGINGVFVAAIGIHESNWGTSKIATDKKNLFGYGAYDMNSYSSAYSYNGYAAGIDMIARVLTKHYLNQKGTSIYDGEVATGKYYNGSNLNGVNKKYATDNNWSNGVYKWMNYLYNRL